MRTFRLNNKPHQVAQTWAELTAAQLLAIAPHLREDSGPARLHVLRALCPGVPVRLLRKLTDDQLLELLELVGWLWQQEPDYRTVTEFTHQGRTYRLPEPNLLDAVTIEYAMAALFFHQFARPKQPQLTALDSLVATLCRPLRPALAQLQRDPAWDGQARERYNGKIAEARAREFATLPVGVKIVVLHHFLAAQRFIHAAYKDLFKKSEQVAPDAPPAPPRGDGTEFLELVATLAEQGIYGTYEQVTHTSLHTVLFNLAKQARRRREAERNQ